MEVNTETGFMLDRLNGLRMSYELYCSSHVGHIDTDSCLYGRKFIEQPQSIRCARKNRIRSQLARECNDMGW